MKENVMSEPISGTAAGIFSWKLIGGLAGMGAIGAGLATIVVMSMTKPESDREWRVALICTVIGSIGGGCAFIRYFGLQDWAFDPFGMVGLLSIAFTCGLPAWAVVRALFIYMDKKKANDIMEIVNELKGKV